jgi:hypothetical protein
MSRTPSFWQGYHAMGELSEEDLAELNAPWPEDEELPLAA